MSSHPAFDRIVGTWAGSGFGEYPTIEDFEYHEESEFRDIGKPYLVYAQHTWSPDGARMHVETGFLRLIGDWAEFTIAQPMGQSELLEGSVRVQGGEVVIDVRGQVLNSSTAVAVDATARRLVFTGEELTASFDMQASGCPLTRHLTASLRRTSLGRDEDE